MQPTMSFSAKQVSNNSADHFRRNVNYFFVSYSSSLIKILLQQIVIEWNGEIKGQLFN